MIFLISIGKSKNTVSSSQDLMAYGYLWFHFLEKSSRDALADSLVGAF